MSKKRARKIKLFLFDVDGVLTDGKLFFLPLPADGEQHVEASSGKGFKQLDSGADIQGAIEFKGFNAHDGAGISMAKLAGLKTGLITKRTSRTVELRARDLKLDHVYQGIHDKLSAFQEIIKAEGIHASEAAYVGDDVVDLPVMRNCGLAIAVANARKEVKDEAHWVTANSGGNGAVRDALEYILKAQGRWKQVVNQYIGKEVQKPNQTRRSRRENLKSK
ncbi:MAG TPA: HAD hydrolase family protein [Terriglobales bacterium]|nr:HAD hydrolase family protein [Terriglobales bacterium]